MTNSEAWVVVPAAAARLPLSLYRPVHASTADRETRPAPSWPQCMYRHLSGEAADVRMQIQVQAIVLGGDQDRFPQGGSTLEQDGPSRNRCDGNRVESAGHALDKPHGADHDLQRASLRRG
jgi:hypothetical protein